MVHDIKNLKYNAPEYCYCRGILNCDIDGKHYTFDKPFWESGGSVSWSDGVDHVTQGDWQLNETYIPEEITKEIAIELIEAMNDYLPKGCCGGCT
jgi:hypothetical protein